MDTSNSFGLGSQVFTPTTVTALTLPAGTKHVMLSVRGAGVFLTEDSSPPSASNGVYIPAGTILLQNNDATYLGALRLLASDDAGGPAIVGRSVRVQCGGLSWRHFLEASQVFPELLRQVFVTLQRKQVRSVLQRSNKKVSLVERFLFRVSQERFHRVMIRCLGGIFDSFRCAPHDSSLELHAHAVHARIIWRSLIIAGDLTKRQLISQGGLSYDQGS